MASSAEKGKGHADHPSIPNSLEEKLAAAGLDLDDDDIEGLGEDDEDDDFLEEDDEGDDISDWEIEEGVPQFSEPFLQQFLRGREALIEQEESKRSDYAFQQSLSPLAREACSIVSNILDSERDTIWNHSHPDNVEEKGGVTLFPGMPFSLAKERMQKTKSWQIVKKMPKGALLHAHVDATLDVDFVIDRALETENMTITTDIPLTDPTSLATAKILFHSQPTPDSTTAAASSIWTPSCSPSTFYSLQAAATSFPAGGTPGFKSWLLSRCIITPPESLEHHHGVDHVWQRFAAIFPILNSLAFHEPILRPALTHMLTQLAADKIHWVDFRCVFIQPLSPTNPSSEAPSDPATAFLTLFSSVLSHFQSTPAGSSFWGARFIWTSLRSWPKKQIISHMKSCIAAKQRFPSLIAGYDLVGQEDAGRPLTSLLPELFWFKKACAGAGVSIPFYFHAGETLASGSAADHNLFDAILLGTRRLGHAFSLYKHPLLVDLVKQKRICVECCPISHEVLRLTHSVKAHPLPALLARGVACCLANDDPGVLGQGDCGLTYDFWQALQGWEGLGLAGLGSLAENSVRWAALGGDVGQGEWVQNVGKGAQGEGERGERMREWAVEWRGFCEWIVREYGLEFGGDGID